MHSPTVGRHKGSVWSHDLTGVTIRIVILSVLLERIVNHAQRANDTIYLPGKSSVNYVPIIVIDCVLQSTRSGRLAVVIESLSFPVRRPREKGADK